MSKANIIKIVVASITKRTTLYDVYINGKIHCFFMDEFIEYQEDLVALYLRKYHRLTHKVK
jgi:hypothetical protein